MKKNIQIAVLLSGILIFGISCSENTMDDINRNRNNPENMLTRLMLTDAMVRSAFSITGSDLAFYAAVYMEHSVGTHGQMFQAEIRGGEPTSSTTYNNSWNSIYINLRTLRNVIERCSPGGSEEGNYHNLGIAQILTAYNLAILTDLFGDVPWSEALQPGIIFAPNLDSQESIYRDIFQLLEDGIENLGRTTTFPVLGGQDFIYAGNAASIANWIRFGYGLKARYTMRLSHRTPNYQEVLRLAALSFQNRNQEARFAYNGTSTRSPFNEFTQVRNAKGASQSLFDRLNERNDPRIDIFFIPQPDEDAIEFAPNGSPAEGQGRYGLSGLNSSTAPTFLMSFHELQFLIAEAHVRLGNLPEARTALLRAITAAFAKVNVGLSAEEAEEYFNTLTLTTQQELLSEIMVQKYLAFFEEEAIEAFNDYRRLRAKGERFVVLQNPHNTRAGGGFPLRFTYGQSDVSTNVNVRNAFGDGTYVFTENVWWAGGSR